MRQEPFPRWLYILWRDSEPSEEVELMLEFTVREPKKIKNFWYRNFARISSKRTQQTSKNLSNQIAVRQRDIRTQPNPRDQRRFASFFFRWSLDKNTRLIFCIMPDVNGRNVQRFGSSVIHYWRWVEAGFLVELMRLTDFINSLPLPKRQRLSGLASLKWVKPCEKLVRELWEVAKIVFLWYSFCERGRD